MFGDASGDAFAPESETGRFEGTAHVLDHLCFRKAGFFANGVETGAVMPCHPNEGIGGFG